MDKYLPAPTAERIEAFTSVIFQDGPIDVVGINGCFVEDIIQIAIDRLKVLNVAPYNCRENSQAISALEEALGRLHLRTLARMGRGVEGTHTP